jgi:MYXO-CTERM domain-containing protein
MRLRALNRRLLAWVLLLASLMMVMAVPMAWAQAPGAPPIESPRTSTPAESPQTSTIDNNMDTRDDSSGEWGLLGLVGLLGLAGLMRRDRTPLLERTREQVGRL